MSRQAASNASDAPRKRVRRGSAADHASLREAILDAAFALHAHQGIDAVSMRALAAELGLSPMALYRYFGSKADLLHAMSERVMAAAEINTVRALAGHRTARARLRSSIEAFLRYWETHPAHFRLFYMTPQTLATGSASPLTQAPAYQRNVGRSETLIREFIAEVGGDPGRTALARDLRLSLMLGYLHSRIVNTRYPWSDFDALRACVIETITLGIERCVQHD